LFFIINIYKTKISAKTNTEEQTSNMSGCLSADEVLGFVASGNSEEEISSCGSSSEEGMDDPPCSSAFAN